MEKLSEKMKGTKSIEEFPQFKNTQETRSPFQIKITNELASLLSALNIHRIMSIDQDLVKGLD